MKKHLIILAIVTMFANTINAQGFKNKDSLQMLPLKGNFGLELGLNINQNMVGFTLLDGLNMLRIKYFIKDNIALRGGVEIGYHNYSSTYQLKDATKPTAVYPNLPTMKNDIYTINNATYGIQLGVEKWQGARKLQWYYGGVMIINYGYITESIEYGQYVNGKTTGLLDVTTQNTSNIFMSSGSNINSIDDLNGTSRITKITTDNGINIGLKGVIGFHYFILPKISIGTEYMWGFVFNTGNSITTEAQTVGFKQNTTVKSVDFITTTKSGASTFSINSGLLSLKMGFFF